MPGPPPIIQAALAASVGVGGVTPPFTIPAHFPPYAYLPPAAHESLLHPNFPSEADTLAYVDALKHSDLSDWRSLQEVAARAGAGSCSGAVTTSVLTALYLLGLFNLCVASPASCCVPPAAGRRRRRTVDPTLPPLLNNLPYNLSSLSLEQFRSLPHVTTPDGGRVPLHISVVEQVRKLWDSNPRLLSSRSCSSAMESVRSSFISLSGVASGIILAYSVAQLAQCYPDHTLDPSTPPKIWLFPIPRTVSPQPYSPIPMLPGQIPVLGKDEDDDGCDRDEVPLGYDSCAQLLSAEPCPYKHWVLLNKDTRMGECVPRLCADNFVYIEADQMCHDINEADICPGNRRLYLTASGKAVCDCPEGMFPGPHDTCYFLYEPAYCQQGSVLQFDKTTKTLTCKADPCGHVNSDLWPDLLPYAPRKDGSCYRFNEQGPCKRGQRFGYDTEQLEATCVSLQEAGLVRPRRSFMFHQMSFPAAQDNRYLQYQVSYIIKNLTDWELEVKGIKRTRRDVSGTPEGGSRLHPSHKVVPFLDTRDIPRSFYTLKRPRRSRWGTPKPRRGNHRTRHHRHIRNRRNHSDGSDATGVTLGALALSPGPADVGGPHKNTRTRGTTRHRARSRNQKSRSHSATKSRTEVGIVSGSTMHSIHSTQRGNLDHSSIVRVNQTALAAPVVVQQTLSSRNTSAHLSSRGEHRQNRGSRGRKGKKKGHGRRKKGHGVRGKTKHENRQERGQRRGRRRKKKPSMSNATQTKRKKPKVSLFHGPAMLLPTDGNTTANGSHSSIGNSNGDQNSHSDISGERLDADEESQQSSSSEMSLPKYLRNRGRRQLGEGGGIIQAPLLSACKPGAKRDYNYKCRPKFIPQERDRRRAGAGSNSIAPRPPTITCPQGTRLDPRGKCQQVS
ncbi:hypothetical protein OTU49_004912 [Cherax quadricarinatus]|uniref:DUF4789 domain-containing protein n=1 Tax=Cherax quadricarinatus TaxID=27406 RepID=A0AAW0WXC7_CHEQU|nr:uncharacterized protein LOC128697497 [Cherax quadricarinatus]